MDISIKIIIVLLALVILYLGISFIISIFLSNVLMKANRRTFEYMEDFDTNNGFKSAYDDYRNVWDRHPFNLDINGVKIDGEYIVNPASTGAKKKVAIICHGHTVNRAPSLKYGQIFYKLGYNIIVFDERYFGKSTGKYCTLGYMESKDISEIIKYARTIFGEDAFICTHGESMGAASELLALKYEKPAFVVADCPFADTEMLSLKLAKNMVHFFGPAAIAIGRLVCMSRFKGYDFRKVNPIEAVVESDTPICFIHGANDNYIPCSHSEIMFKQVKNPLSELHLIPGADHAMSIATDAKEYEKIVTDFVKKVEKEYYK